MTKETGYLKLTLTRLDFLSSGVFGHLTIGDEFDCVTLERGDTLIPVGFYKITMYDSPHFKMKVPLLNGVPDREFIEIHPADRQTELKGCIALAKRRTGMENLNPDVFASDMNRKTFEDFMKVMNKALEWDIEVR